MPGATNPQAFNRYSYANNNPLRFTDPTGHCIEEGDAPPGSSLYRYRNICPIRRSSLPKQVLPTGTPMPLATPTPAVIQTYTPTATATPSTPTPTYQRGPSTADGGYYSTGSGGNWYPNAVIAGVSAGDGTGGLYNVVGAEDVVLFNDDGIDIEAFTYAGTGTGGGGEVSVYFGLVWNLPDYDSYLGPFNTYSVTFVDYTLNLFTDLSGDGFSGIWGISVSPGTGIGLSASGAVTFYERH